MQRFFFQSASYSELIKDFQNKNVLSKSNIGNIITA